VPQPFQMCQQQFSNLIHDKHDKFSSTPFQAASLNVESDSNQQNNSFLVDDIILNYVK